MERGCGYREQDSLYVCVPTDPDGMPIDWFLTDPVRPWHGGQLRGPMLIQDPRMGVYHLVLGVGASYYPFVSDFVEEARRLGVSKRIPSNFDTSKLTIGKSGLVLVHPRAIPEFPYNVIDGPGCPKERWIPDLHDDGSLCIGDLWHLSSLKDYDHYHELNLDQDEIVVKTPSCSYPVKSAYPLKSEKSIMDYSAGSILFFPKMSFEYVNKKGVAPEALAKPIIAQGWPFKVVEE